MNHNQAQWHGEMTDGAQWAIKSPSSWNGILVIEPDLRRGEVDNSIYAWLHSQGVASARLARDVHAFDFPRTLDHLNTLHGEAIRRLGSPETTVIWGRSLGALTTRLVLEQRTVQVDGAIAVDGGGMGARGPFQAGRDAKFVLASLSEIPDVLDAPDSLKALLENWARTPQGRARLALAAAYRGTMGGSGNRTQQLETILNGLILDLSESHVLWTRAKGLAGGDFTGNLGYDYTRAFHDSPTSELVAEAYAEADLSLDEDLEMVAGASRHEPESSAAEWMQKHGSVAGGIAVPLLAVKGTTDPMSVPGEDGAYSDMIERSGRSELYRGLHTSRGGHVAQAPIDFAIAFSILLDRLEEARWGELNSPAIQGQAWSVLTAASGTGLLGGTPQDWEHSYIDYPTPVHPRYLQESESGRITA